MAKNPMQRKAQNSFLLGMLITLLITGIIIAFLFFQLTNAQKETKKLLGDRVNVCVLNTDVKSGQVITEDLIKQLEVDRNTIPSNSFGDDVSNLSTYSLTDIAGNTVVTLKVKDSAGNIESKLAVPCINESGEVEKEETTGEVKYRVLETVDDINYYYQATKEAIPSIITNPTTNRSEIETDSRTKEYIYVVNTRTDAKAGDENIKVELTSMPIIAKVDINANSVLTSNIIKKSDKKITDDVRIMEYNMIYLPSQIEDKEYVDVRLRLPNGKDYIVISNKMITIPEVDGVPSLNTISLEMSEDEILTLSCAIIEAYKISGAILYVNRYIEPGLQTAAIPTYMPDVDTANLIRIDPNCVREAQEGIANRYKNTDETTAIRNPINNSLNENSDQANDNAVTSIEEEIQKMQEERQKYLETLGGSY